jgi:uncharacterized protein
MSQNYLEIKLGEIHFFLLHQKAMYRPDRRQLIVADIHLGKASHFRKKGIAMPPQSHLRDIDRLQHLISAWKPEQVLLLGDLFHSDYNREWLWFKSLLLGNSNTTFILVEGNHDILPGKEYELPNLRKVNVLEEDELLYTHKPEDSAQRLNICGHVHPGLRITGLARQSFRLPCFYHRDNLFILPAFGELTGLYLLDRETGADYYLVTHETIVKL